jgi:hypothetical protein
MRRLAEYLEHALEFEQMAAGTDDPALKQQLLNQAAEYRKLAEQRAIQLDMPKPPPAAPPPSKGLTESQADDAFSGSKRN